MHYAGTESMKTLSFENLDFSFLIETDSNTAYLQEWEEGAWSEADRFTVPVAIDSLPKHSKLARALHSFRKHGEYDALRSAVGHGMEASVEPRRVRDLLQAYSRGLASWLVALIYA